MTSSPPEIRPAERDEAKFRLPDADDLAAPQLYRLKYRLITQVGQVCTTPVLDEEPISLMVISEHRVPLAGNFVIAEIQRDPLGVRPTDAIDAESYGP
jgi:hypothetical protein